MLEGLPAVDRVLEAPAVAALATEFGHEFLKHSARRAIAELRFGLQSSTVTGDRNTLLAAAVRGVVADADAYGKMRFRRVVNATGVVLHTNLGRAPLAAAAIRAMTDVAGYGNLEMDLETGERSHRGREIEGLWQQLTSAEACLIVNNCAAATFLVLHAMASGMEVAVSRGQLIEIGGAYRLPDVFAQSTAVLREVGTTNRTRLVDYERAIVDGKTAALLRVHPSNFRVVGFVEEVGISALAELAHRRGIWAIDDVGSGLLVDLAPFGLLGEPTVAASLAAGADLVLFSGDKLLGGPQCGVILGKRAAIERIRQSPLSRALRVDKATLAALQATLEIYRRGVHFAEIPVLRMLASRPEELARRAEALAARMPTELGATVQPSESAVGGGSLPLAQLPTTVVRLAPVGLTADELARRFRWAAVPVVARIERGAVLLDPRTVAPGGEEADLLSAARWVVEGLREI